MQASQIGQFEWFIERDHLVLQSVGGYAPYLAFAGWGMASSTVSERDIQAIVLYAEALSKANVGDGWLERVHKKFCSITFADCLNELRSFVEIANSPPQKAPAFEGQGRVYLPEFEDVKQIVPVTNQELTPPQADAPAC